MTYQELITKLHIETLSPAEQQEYVDNLFNLAIKRAGYEMTWNLPEEKQQQLAQALEESTVTDVSDAIAKVISNQEQEATVLRVFNELVEEISSGVDDTLARLNQ